MTEHPMSDVRNLLDAVAAFIETCDAPRPKVARIAQLQDEIFEVVDRMAAAARRSATA